jgi:hypothetical protein
LLIFAPLDNHSGISKNGNVTAEFKGTWALPGMDFSKWNGTFDGTFWGQVIVRNFSMDGTFDGLMKYDSDYVVTFPASIDLLH